MPTSSLQRADFVRESENQFDEKRARRQRSGSDGLRHARFLPQSPTATQVPWDARQLRLRVPDFHDPMSIYRIL